MNRKKIVVERGYKGRERRGKKREKIRKIVKRKEEDDWGDDAS